VLHAALKRVIQNRNNSATVVVSVDLSYVEERFVGKCMVLFGKDLQNIEIGKM
jgi:hypothetical protein